MRALAFAHLGNARRVLGELRGAEEAFARAAELWEKYERETGDHLGHGPVILDLKASLRRGQRRFDEALDLLDQVVTAYRDGDPERRDLHLAGRALINKAYTFDQMLVGRRDAGAPSLSPFRQRRRGWAFQLNHPVYDCIYLALGLQLDGKLATADRGGIAAAAR